MKIKRSHVIAAIIILMVGTVWVKGFWFTEVFHTRKSNEPHRAALLQIRDAVSVGASHAEVLAAYWRHRTDSLRLFADRPTDWIITMPMEFGASDWKLLIEFHDGRASAVRVRTSDGPPPEDGPKDKQKDTGKQVDGDEPPPRHSAHSWAGVRAPRSRSGLQSRRRSLSFPLAYGEAFIGCFQSAGLAESSRGS